jgi:hypothetical protein
MQKKQHLSNWTQRLVKKWSENIFADQNYLDLAE